MPAPAAALPDARFWAGRRVLVTGDTGFKGAWLCLWLAQLGAEVTGFADGVPTDPSLYALARVADAVEHLAGDIRDPEAVAAAVARARPEIVLHLAAQPMVRRSYAEPVATYATNIMGTVHVLDAIRRTPGNVLAAIVVTSDKCYENDGRPRALREDEAMGGHDPYSSSKGAAELVTAAYRSSYFAHDGAPAIASARAGNVIGGGDWGEDRLVPDLFRAALAGTPLRIRNPEAVRPWQHVLNPLSGYLRLAERAATDPADARGWNFGPADADAHPVAWIVDRIAERWDGPIAREIDPGPHPHEAHWLKLDSSLARAQLDWAPAWDLAAGLDQTTAWYRAYRDGADVRDTTMAQIAAFGD